jgi:hypothetical protein
VATSHRMPEAEDEEELWPPVQRYLIERQRLFSRIRTGVRLPELIGQMIVISTLFAAAYGVTVGAFAGGWQPLLNAIKFPSALLMTFVLCVPALHLLGPRFGSRLSLAQTAAVVLSAIVVTTTLLGALTPALGLLMLTSLSDHSVVVFVNLTAIVACGVAGARFALIAASSAQWETPEALGSFSRFMKVWLLFYGFLGLQMLWLFRPYFRQTDVFIRPLGESAIWHTLKLLLGVLHLG